LLREAQRKGIVQISVRSPRFEGLEEEIRKRYGLRDVRVVQHWNDENALRTELGRESAAYFDQNVSDGFQVGISSGRTIFEMASRVPERARKISIFPVNAVADVDTTIKGLGANTTATILWFRSRPLATSHRVEMFFPGGTGASIGQKSKEILDSQAVRELAEQVRDLDCYFLGSGEVREESQLQLLLRRSGIQMSPVAAGAMVGDVAFNALDVDGSVMKMGIEDWLFRVEAEDLRRAVEKGRMVVLVAGGAEKHPIIQAATKGRLLNVLITDSETARALLARPGTTSPFRQRHAN